METDDRRVGIAVRAAESRMSARTTVMCLLCQTAQFGDAVMCADLGCAVRVRTEIPRVWGFVDAVRR